MKDKLDETGVALKVVNESVNERWEVCLTMSEKGFQQISFVNSIATTKVFIGSVSAASFFFQYHAALVRNTEAVFISGWQTH